MGRAQMNHLLQVNRHRMLDHRNQLPDKGLEHPLWVQKRQKRVQKSCLPAKKVQGMILLPLLQFKAEEFKEAVADQSQLLLVVKQFLYPEINQRNQKMLSLSQRKLSSQLKPWSLHKMFNQHKTSSQHKTFSQLKLNNPQKLPPRLQLSPQARLCLQPKHLLRLPR